MADKKTVIEEIAAERKRQIEAEGFVDQHDEEHDHGELSQAAAVYAAHASAEINSNHEEPNFSDAHTAQYFVQHGWPWADDCWKPKNPRRDLIRAAALIVAEIERLDRKDSTDGR